MAQTKLQPSQPYDSKTNDACKMSRTHEHRNGRLSFLQNVGQVKRTLNSSDLGQPFYLHTMGNNGSTAVVSAFTDPISVRLEVVNLLLKYLLPELLADEFDHLQVICEATAFCCVSAHTSPLEQFHFTWEDFAMLKSFNKSTGRKC